MGHHMYFIHSQPQSVHLSFMLPLKQFAPRSASNNQFRLVQFLTCLYILLSILGLPKEFPLQILCVRKICMQAIPSCPFGVSAVGFSKSPQLPWSCRHIGAGFHLFLKGSPLHTVVVHLACELRMTNLLSLLSGSDLDQPSHTHVL